ncbi:sensor histidine kinase [Marinilongibacter aquaticus]|uniref:sensor histidine kinase n=1 Tax=Marinilongibacter aquaticus TaxID=2975157 RepID=UPI0021BD2B58|nr:sensor histidine kinase [Marinilongibacter aquaticus]UBM60940.1 sensor histidine kinase [Marinilongibacter aquaticus]
MTSSTSIFTIIIGIALFILMALSVIVFVVYYQRKQFKLQLKQQAELKELDAQAQQKLLKNSINVQESERRKIAKDLHDEIGGLLSAAKMGLQTFERTMQLGENQKNQYRQSVDLVNESLVHVRGLSRELTPKTLENYGLHAALHDFVDKINLTTEIEFNVDIQGLDRNDRFHQDVELTIYRLLQEMTNNALKHSQAKQIYIALKKEKGNLIFIFSDNGQGFDIAEKANSRHTGLGLDNISSRVQVIGGQYRIQSEIGLGTQYFVQIPLSSNELKQ